MTMTHTFTRTHTVTVPANPYLICDQCSRRVEGFADLPGPLELYPCGHQSGYSDICPSWGPVDGCTCERTFGYVPHAPAQKPRTEEGMRQGPL